MQHTNFHHINFESQLHLILCRANGEPIRFSSIGSGCLHLDYQPAPNVLQGSSAVALPWVSWLKEASGNRNW